jgi:2-haloacid dehalogenase
MPIGACVFDAYGTLFDVAAAARRAATEDHPELGEVWPGLAADWRDRQLQYTWIRAVTGAHADFWQVTGDGLDWALEARGIDDPALRARLMQLYRELTAYGEVNDVLADLKQAGIPRGILSNGTPDMLADACGSAGIAGLLDHVLSVESVGVFKPARAVYDLVGRAFGVEPGEVLFVSANGWDAAAAAGHGFRTAWVNRAGAPVERLPWRPEHMLDDLSGVPDLAGRL